MKKILLTASFIATAALACSAQAQTWQGAYVGGSVATSKASGSGEHLTFDTNLDGQYGDTVNTFLATDYFSPGFCKGAANGKMPSDGCRKDGSKAGIGLRAGYDWQSDHIVYGLVGEVSSADVKSSVSGFSTAPDSYVFTRKLNTLYALRGRIGYDYQGWLAYATAGFAWADIDRSFATTNALNSFSAGKTKRGSGTQIGLGVEKRFTPEWTFGLEYLRTSLDDKGPVVRAAGSSQTFASNPFLIANSAGTDIRRSEDQFKIDTFMITATYRFGPMSF